MNRKSAWIGREGRIARLAAAQHGVVSRKQLRRLGLNDHEIEGRLRRVQLHLVHRGVYAVGHPRLTREGRWAAALLALGDGAVLSHRTAADLWRIALSESEIVDVTIESTAGRKRRRGIRLRRGPLPQNEVTRRSGFPVTTIARTLLDLAAVVSRRVLERAIDEAQYLGLFDAEALNDALHANGARPGCGKLRSVLPDHCPGSTRTRSPLEERFLAFCRRHRLPPPELGVPIGPYEADFLWREQRLIVETDGRDGHDTAKAFEHDRARDAYLAVKGFRVVRYTDRRLKREAATVVAELRALLVA